jgi:hypothetical protein
MKWVWGTKVPIEYDNSNHSLRFTFNQNNSKMTSLETVTTDHSGSKCKYKNKHPNKELLQPV